MLSLLVAGLPSAGSAQEEENDPIFRRFEMSRKRPRNWQAFFEIPAYLRPQGERDAEIEENLGLNYVTSFRPNRRVYFSRSVAVTRMEWFPQDSAVRRVRVKTLDVSMLLNNLFGSTLVTSYGLGVGIMDGVINFNDDRIFDTRLEPFFPLQFGLSVRLGGDVQLGLKYSQFFFFRGDPIISNSRLLLGLGFNY